MKQIALKLCSLIVACFFIVFLFPVPQVHAAETADTVEKYTIEDLGNGFTAETTFIIHGSDSRSSSTSATLVRTFKQDGSWIATVTFNASFGYNGISSGVLSTDSSVSLKDGWSYTDQKITKSGGTATLTANLKKFPLVVPVDMNIHCTPDGKLSKW